MFNISEYIVIEEENLFKAMIYVFVKRESAVLNLQKILR